MVNSTYGADDLQSLEGLEAVRKRPGMYIGSTDSLGVQHLVWEIVDNSVDEALAGHAKRIDVYLNTDGSVQVEDDGRGIPTGINTKTGLSGVELALTKLHAGGKFGGGGYKSAGGLHGVGSSVVNALSARMDAVVYQNDKEHKVSFQRGKTGVFASEGPDAKFTAKAGLVASADKRTAAQKKARPTGTTIRWWHDPLIFLPGSSVDIDKIMDRARTTAFLVPGLTLAIHDLRDPKNPREEEFSFTGGVSDMVEFLASDAKISDPIIVDTTASFVETVPVLNDEGHMESKDVEREVEIKIAFRWGTKYDYTLRSFVNVVNTPHGGTHVRGFERGVTKAIVDTIKSRRGLLKSNEDSPNYEDISEGLTAVVSVGLPEPQFLGQTKEALGTAAVTRLVQTAVIDALTSWLNARKNATESKTILEKIVTASRNRHALRAQKEVARRKTALQAASMPAKLVDCSEVGTDFTELLICEGDSALGTIKAARDSRYQAILPIRGKILNVQKASVTEMLKNAEISDIIQVIGAGAGKSFDVDAMRVSKVILASDADQDGLHIQVLLITLFWKLFRPMIEQGRLYIAVPPLFVIKTKGKNSETIYAENEFEKDKVIVRLEKSNKSVDSIQRLKGLGEMNADIFWQTTLNPETRTLRQITVEDAEAAANMLELAMGSKPEPRRDWIIASRDKVDDELIDA